MKHIPEITISIMLIIILIMLTRPSGLLMPESLEMLLSLGLIVTFLVFTGLFWKERASDEREEQHLSKAGRLSFIIGTATLVVGIAYQSLSHEIDPWLVATLAVMVLVKLLTRLYNQIKN